MKSLICIMAILIALSPVSQLNAAEDEPLSVLKIGPKSTARLMQGMALGIGASNVRLLLSGRRQLYCRPAGIGGRLIWNLASQVLAGPHEPITIAIVAVDELQLKFPCQQ